MIKKLNTLTTYKKRENISPIRSVNQSITSTYNTYRRRQWKYVTLLHESRFKVDNVLDEINQSCECMIDENNILFVLKRETYSSKASASHIANVYCAVSDEKESSAVPRLKDCDGGNKK